jgi:hypothetical protein
MLRLLSAWFGSDKIIILSYLYRSTWRKIPGYPKNLRQRHLGRTHLDFQRPNRRRMLFFFRRWE